MRFRSAFRLADRRIRWALFTNTSLNLVGSIDSLNHTLGSLFKDLLMRILTLKCTEEHRLPVSNSGSRWSLQLGLVSITSWLHESPQALTSLKFLQVVNPKLSSWKSHEERGVCSQIFMGGSFKQWTKKRPFKRLWFLYRIEGVLLRAQCGSLTLAL